MPKLDPTKNLWRSVVALHQAKGRTRADAINLVIVEWLLKGDVEPLLDAVADGEITDPVLSVVALMLTRDESLPYYLSVQRQRGRGAPKKPGLQWRNAFAALAYEQRCKEVGSEQAFKEIAAAFGIDAATIRAAVTWYRQAIERTTLNKS
jgi:hypothetical protein